MRYLGTHNGLNIGKKVFLSYLAAMVLGAVFAALASPTQPGITSATSPQVQIIPGTVVPAQQTLEPTIPVSAVPAAQIPAVTSAVILPEGSKAVSFDVPEEVVVGATLDLSETEVTVGETIRTTIENYFKMINQKKLLGNRTLKFVAFDDQNDPDRSRECVRQMIKESNIKALLCSAGTTVRGYLDLIKNGDTIMLLPVAADVVFFGQQQNANYVLFGASIVETLISMSNYIVDKLGKNIIAAFFYKAVVENYIEDTSKALLEKIGFSKVLYLPYLSEKDISFAAQAEICKKEKPAFIMLIGGLAAGLTFVMDLGPEFFSTCNLLSGAAYLNNNKMRSTLKEKGIKFVSPSLTPNPSSDMKICKDFVEFAKLFSIGQDSIAFQAYVSARIFVEVIKKIPSPVTKEKILEAIKNIKNFNLDGLQLNYDPITRRLSHIFWVDNETDKWDVIDANRLKFPGVTDFPALSQSTILHVTATTAATQPQPVTTPSTPAVAGHVTAVTKPATTVKVQSVTTPTAPSIPKQPSPVPMRPSVVHSMGAHFSGMSTVLASIQEIAPALVVHGGQKHAANKRNNVIKSDSI